MTRLEEVQYLRTEPDGRHYNCAQSLLVPFASEVGLTKEQADALGANFGAGMKMGSTCGVLTSALMLLGMKGCTPQQAAQLVQRFREKHQDTNALPGEAPGHQLRRPALQGQGGGDSQEGALRQSGAGDGQDPGRGVFRPGAVTVPEASPLVPQMPKGEAPPGFPF